MRKLVVLAGLVALFVLPVAQAAVQTNVKVPLTGFLVDIPCANGGAGETVELNGTLHILLTFTINGNNVSGKDHFQPQNLSGVGSVSGDSYQGTGVTQSTFKSPLVPGASGDTFTFVNNFRIIGQGPGNNVLVHTVTHVTINANGDVTADVSLDRSECK